MTTLLLTGGSGFVGRHFIEKYARSYDIISLSRKPPSETTSVRWLQADFSDPESLKSLDLPHIDVLVHLGAVTGGCSEEDGMAINVEGTRLLMRHAAEHGCRRFVLASSIAVVGTKDKNFFPLALPITEAHPCLDKHGYGFSKYLMEEVAGYLCRQNPEACAVNLRLAGLRASGTAITPKPPSQRHPWFFNGFCILSVTDACRALDLAIQADLPAGNHRYFVGPPQSTVDEPVATLLANTFGPCQELEYFKQSDKAYAPLFCVDKIRQELGFVATDLPDWMHNRQTVETLGP